ncbi:hypothetical protein VZC37_00495 [Gordonia sp. LSe1-13]|uniref:Uncharacterized protein n=1 Tax=Gordonia sesuvii TaxID=3116777 RepID=A0ABU7M6R0_9ACTN|nr:hypothetical protein [Gordonia sp. LSe1-13]
MEPVEINAGTWYLRSLRADDRITDVPALSDLGVDDPARYVTAADTGWADESRFVWAICIPTTGELVAVVELIPEGDVARLRGRARDGYAEAFDAAVGPVTRFATGMLGVTVIPAP